MTNVTMNSKIKYRDKNGKFITKKMLDRREKCLKNFKLYAAKAKEIREIQNIQNERNIESECVVEVRNSYNMRAQAVKQCIVQKCNNNSKAVPEKHFLTIPINRDVRAKWFKALNMADKAINATQYFVCEDHFDLKEDMQNWMYFKTIGTKLQIKKHVVPHRNLGDIGHESVPTSQLSGSERKWKDSNLIRFRAENGVKKKTRGRKKKRKSAPKIPPQVQHSTQSIVVPKPVISIAPVLEVPKMLPQMQRSIEKHSIQSTAVAKQHIVNAQICSCQTQKKLPQTHNSAVPKQPVVLNFRPVASESPKILSNNLNFQSPVGLIMLAGVANPIPLYGNNISGLANTVMCINPGNNPTGVANPVICFSPSSGSNGKEIANPIMFINSSRGSNTIPNIMNIPVVNTSHNQSPALNTTQLNEQIHIKDEPLDTNHNDWEMYQEMKKEIKNSDSANQNNISIHKESVVNVKQEYSDSDNQINVTTENVPVFENVFIKVEPIDEDFYS